AGPGETDGCVRIHPEDPFVVEANAPPGTSSHRRASGSVVSSGETCPLAMDCPDDIPFTARVTAPRGRPNHSPSWLATASMTRVTPKPVCLQAHSKEQDR